MYALNLNPNTGRVLSATFPEYATQDMPQVEALPQGDISNYRFQNGEFVYDPIPAPTVPAPKNYAAGQIFPYGNKLYRATTAIVKGESLTLNNVEEVTIADILNALNAQEGN